MSELPRVRIGLCNEHREVIHLGLSFVGLGSLIPETAAEAESRLLSQDDHGLTLDNFEPVFAATTLIAFVALTILDGIYGIDPVLVYPDPFARWRCPICTLNQYMVAGAAQAALQRWKELGGNDD
jgi:hypothetical protein